MPRRGRNPAPPKNIGRHIPVAPSTKSLPVVQPQPSPVPAPLASTQQPSLFKQMAATAGGVAIGSAVGHTIGAGLTNMLERKDSDHANSQMDMTKLADTESKRSIQEPCSLELKQFLQCSQNQTDIALCQGFNEALRQCKAQYGV